MQRLVVILFLSISVSYCLGAETALKIGSSENIRYNEETQIAITLENQAGFEMGGFDLLITYSPSLTLQSVDTGSMITGCNWEYFTSQPVGANSVRLVGIAETINGPYHPTCFGTGQDTLAVLTFLVSEFQPLGCQFIPIYWEWYDCGDNAISSIIGDTTFISADVYEFDGELYFPIAQDSTFPTQSGAPDQCPPNYRGLDFYGGGVYVLYHDMIRPQAICPENIEGAIDSNECGAWATFSIGGEDNCPGLVYYSEPPSGSFFPAGTTPVSCIARDYSGNADTCIFEIRVHDTIAPVLSVPGDITVGSYLGLCGAAVGYEVTATDNCYETAVYCNPPSGSFIPIGDKTITCLAVDVAGNMDSTQFMITVKDTEPPELSLPENITVSNDPDQCGALVYYETSVSDNCSGSSLSCSPASGSYFEVGESTVTCIGTDTQGNADTGTFQISVIDTMPPIINCPNNKVVANYPDQCGAIVDFSVQANDNCPGVFVVTLPQSGSFFEKGTSLVKVIAADAVGNSDTCEFTVTVDDLQPPGVICPEDITVYNDSGLYGAVVDFEISGIDNCPGVETSSDPPAGSVFDTGITQVQAIAIDLTGKADTGYFKVEVVLNDPDSDGRPDWDDNCPALFNPGQGDIDNDGHGNVCDSCTDIDGDGYGNPGYSSNVCPEDNCPEINNPDQLDADSDGFGDICDICPGHDDAADMDGDGIPDGCDYICGDANGDGMINVGDAVHLISYVFKNGPSPDPLDAGDANCDGHVNVGDAVFLISHVFKSGPEPCCP